MASNDGLSILPLGGCGEVGMNATLLTLEKQSILLDCGAYLGVDGSAGVNKLVPGFEPLFRNERKLAGVVLTHGHEDHIGALSALLAEVDVPVFGTGITCDLVRARLERDTMVVKEARAQSKRVHEIEQDILRVGPFELKPFHVTHSVPGSVAIGVATSEGRLLHTGDFRLDRAPWDGKTSDLEGIGQFCEAGLDVLMSDSTNAEVPGWGRSEQSVAEALKEQVERAKGRVVVTLLASHMHRMAAVDAAAQAAGRKVCLLGRTLQRNWDIGVRRGILPPLCDREVVLDRLGSVPRDQVVVLATGSQGEPQGGMARVAQGRDGITRLQKGETAIFSARTIPGNEVQVRKMQNALARQGVLVVTPDDAPVHASGHARKEEQAELLRLCAPKWFVPVYGERMMLEAHAQTAIQAGMKHDKVLIIENGQALVLQQGELSLGAEEEVSKRPVDGDGMVLDWGDVRQRSRIGRNGLVVCSVALDGRGRLLGEPAITARGVGLDEEAKLNLQQRVREALDDPHLISKALIHSALIDALRIGWASFSKEGRNRPFFEALMVSVASPGSSGHWG